jgi:CRP-like cAMP-binding protein
MNLASLEFEMSRLCAPLQLQLKAKSTFFASLTEKRLQKGEHLLREGETINSLYFVRSGLMRYYYLVDGVEHTGQFFDKGAFFTDIFGVLARAPALLNIDALDISEIIVIPTDALLAAYDADHAFERFGRRMIEQNMIGSQRRTANLLKYAPEELYTQFVLSRPEVADRIPQYMIASYLGITPEALSRIRRRRSKS